MQRPFVVLACGLQGFLFKGVIIYSIYSLESAVFFLNFTHCKYIQWRRSVCMAPLFYNEDGTIQPVKQSSSITIPKIN